MDTLGPHFQIEVNKFKFLNELVSCLKESIICCNKNTSLDSSSEQEVPW